MKEMIFYLGFILSFIFFTCALESQNEMESELMNTKDGMESVTSKDGTKIAYKRTGTGPPLLLLHGSGVSDHRRWEIAGVRSSLAEQFTVYAIDRRER